MFKCGTLPKSGLWFSKQNWLSLIDFTSLDIHVNIKFNDDQSIARNWF